ncbi:MAG TPA: hypothetical protein VF071_02620 [Candidatus Limnocylindria bacterium]
MDLERIERALRDGPPDEPLYVPGSFARPHMSAWLFAFAGVAVTAAIVIGIAIGVGFDAMRAPRVGAPLPSAVMADLEGTWVSDVISLDQWVDELVERGFDPNDIGNFLSHDPFERTARYQLAFDLGQVTISADYDETGMQVLSLGEYTLRDGVFSYVEASDAPSVIGGPCTLDATVNLDGSRLVWENVELHGCGVDPSIAHTVFFDLLPYTRLTGD